MILRIAKGNSVPALTVKYFLLLFYRLTVGVVLGQGLCCPRAEFFEKFLFLKGSNS
jgi:hypothetical protein